MDGFQEILAKLVAPFFYPLLSTQRIYFVYLLAAAGLAAFVYLRAGRGHRARRTVRGFFAWCFPRAVYSHRSAIVDDRFFVINKIAFAFLIAPWILTASATAAWTEAFLSWGLSSPGPQWSAGLGADLALTLCFLLALDGALFVAHFLQHKVPLLWEFHKVHHSAEVMTPITVYRMHPVDDLLSGFMVGAATGLVQGVFGFLFADGPSELLVWKLNLGLFLFYLFGYNLRHSHIWLSYPPAVSRYLVSPAQHQIHHSKAPQHWDRNMGFIFAFWDRMAGTLYVPQSEEEIEYGLDRDEHKVFDSVWALYLRPFKAVAARRRAVSDAKP